jgi:ABC-type Mn2+/Zn2+ transport system ATPase subunit
LLLLDEPMTALDTRSPAAIVTAQMPALRSSR